MELLAEGNVAGKNLLSLVSRGSAIIAEMLRLSDHIPPVFYMANRADQTKYAPILHDFSYLKNPDLHESVVGSDGDLVDLDEQFRDSNLEILERFYRLFESIYKFVKDITRYLEDVEEGVYIQTRLEDLLVDEDGRQLLAEAVYLYGLMLTIMDSRIEGPVRERMLISYYRYKGSAQHHSEVCNLCRSTGYIPGSNKRPPRYPEDLFARLPPPLHVVRMIINRLRSDDIYNQMREWPNPDHRCTALASQAAMVYIVLFFSPDTLHREAATMREIVDKHFSDNWVISFYMGFTVDLSIMWDPYKAAAAALRNTLEPAMVREVHARHAGGVEGLLRQLGERLAEGVLTEECVLDSRPKLMNLLRDCNVTLRWLMLHRIAMNKKIRDYITTGVRPEDILGLLLQTAQLEYQLGETLKRLLATKDERWEGCRKECGERMSELGVYFSGEHTLARVAKDDRLSAWFTGLAAEVSSLDQKDATLAGRRIQQLIAALDDVQQFHQIESSPQAKHCITDAKESLRNMIRVVNIKEQVLITLATVSDFSYAFDIIGEYLTLVHARIRRDPFSVVLVRATLLKLASVLELPLVRISQASSPDLPSVAQYYSTRLVAFVRKVLEVIPESMFTVLNDIITTQTGAMKEMPPRIERAALREYAQLEERYRLARATHQVSVFTEGILAMEKTLMGVVEVDPKELLEEGIRKELVRQITMALHGILIFKTGKVQEVEERLLELQRTLEGFRRSFEYISDYVNVYGLKIWQEEFSRIVNFNVEQECNVFLKKKIYDWESKYQSESIPIPVLPPTDDYSLTFIGRLLKSILNLTDPRRSIYLEAQSGWYAEDGSVEVVGIATCSLLHRSIGTMGVRGLDKTLAFMIVKSLQDFVAFYRRQVHEGLRQFLRDLQSELSPLSTLPGNASKVYASALVRTAKLWPIVMELVSHVGQAQLLRRHLARELNLTGRLDSPLLSSALECTNEALAADIAAHYIHPDRHPYPSTDSSLLGDLAPYLDTLGLSGPAHKIYITTEPLEGVAPTLFLFVLSQLSMFKWDSKLGTLLSRDRRDLLNWDGAALAMGVATLLRQFHSCTSRDFYAYMAQYVRCQIVLASRDKNAKGLPADVTNILRFQEEMARLADSDRGATEQYLPPYILDNPSIGRSA